MSRRYTTDGVMQGKDSLVPSRLTSTVWGLARISHQLTVEAHDRPAITSLRLLTVLNVLFKYASAR